MRAACLCHSLPSGQAWICTANSIVLVDGRRLKHMEDELRALLLASGDVTALVGGRINFGTHPQGDPFPAIVLNVISDAEDYHMKGPNGLFQGRVQIDVYGMTYGAAKAASRPVRTLLHCHRGGGFRLITHVSTRDSREGGTNEVERPFRVGMDFTTAWRAE